MNFSESLLVALFCMAMVFALLACLYILIRLFSIVLRLFEKKSAMQPTDQAILTVPTEEQEEYSSGRLTLKDVDEPTAAIIMAIVSDESGIPLSELCFKSIKQIKNVVTER